MAGDPKKQVLETAASSFLRRIAERRAALAAEGKLTEGLKKRFDEIGSRSVDEQVDRQVLAEAERTKRKTSEPISDQESPQQRADRKLREDREYQARQLREDREYKARQLREERDHADEKAREQHAREDEIAKRQRREKLDDENRADAKEKAKLLREKAAAEAAELARKQKVSQGNADFDRMSVKDKVTDGLAGSKNTHYTPEEFRDKLKMLKDELEDKGVLVTQRRFTHDIKATTDGRDVYSIEQRMLRGDKITVGEFDRYAKSKDKELKNAKAEEEALKKGTLQPHDTPIVKDGKNDPVVPIAHNSSGNKSAFSDLARQGLATVSAKLGGLDRITEIRPALRHVKKTITAVVGAFLAASYFNGTTKENLFTLNFGERILDSATGVLADNPKDKEGKDTAGIGLVRLHKFNIVLAAAKKDPTIWNDVRDRLKVSSVDPDLSVVFTDAMKQPTKPKEVAKAVAEAAAGEAEKNRDRLARETELNAINTQLCNVSKACATKWFEEMKKNPNAPAPAPGTY